MNTQVKMPVGVVGLGAMGMGVALSLVREGFEVHAFDLRPEAVQKVVDLGFIDPKRIGIQGHSWGGYQISYLITKTDMFRAVEAGASVVNMTSAYGGIRWGTGMSRAFQYEKTQSRIGGPPWQFPLQFIDPGLPFVMGLFLPL